MLSPGTLFYAPPVAGSLPSLFCDVACPAVLGLSEPHYDVPFTATEMVAPMVSTSGMRQATAGSELKGTRQLLVPRKGASPAWTSEFSDLLAKHHLSHVQRERKPPITADELKRLLPGYTADYVARLHASLR